MVTRYLCLALAAVVGPARGQDGETANRARDAEIERCLLDLREGKPDQRRTAANRLGHMGAKKPVSE